MIRKIQIQILLNITASIFGGQKKNVLGLSFRDALSTYASATCSWMRESCDETTRQRMFTKMYRLGKLIRNALFIRSEKRAQKWISYLYESIGIYVSFRSEDGRCIMDVSKCYFSEVYTKEMCECISMMDKGLILGITGREDFAFEQRITEGCSKCVACIGNRECK